MSGLFHFAGSAPASISVFLVCQFNIIQKIIIACPYAKGIGRTISHHKRIDLIIVGYVGNLFDNIVAKTVIDEFFLFLVFQSALEGKDTPGPVETKDIDKLIQIHPNPRSGAH